MLTTTGEACFCDYSFCNNPLEETTIITDSSPYLPSTSSEPAVVSTTTMNSLQTTTFTDSKITLPSTSFEAPETLTCFACSGKDCETGRIGTETCSNGDICSYVNIQIIIEVGNPVFLLERGCKSANQFNADPCVTSADYVGLDFMLTTTGEACFCDYSFCNSPLEETTIITDSSPYLPSTSSEPAVVSTTTMNSLQTTTFTDSKITLPSTSFEAPETLTCFACSGKDCETGRIGTETCSNGDICSYVNIQIFIEEGNPVFLLERGCKSANQFNADPCVTSADYVGLDFMLTTTGEACFCDYSFCNSPLEETTIITDSSPYLPSTSSEPAVVSTTTMNSLQTTTFTDSKITLPSTSFEAPETLTCFACSGKDCETGRIGTETCSNGDICSYVNIQIIIEVGNPVFLLERGCKSANQFNADPCVTSADYVGLDFMLTTTGEACFCDYSFCNSPLEETTIITDSSPYLPSTSSEPAVVSTTTMNSLQTTTFTDSKITLPSTSFEAPETLTCFACSGKDCETGRIGTETCSNGDICSYVNIQIFIEEGNPVFLLERGCKSANQFNADPCVTSADYVGLDFMLTTTGEACFCDYSFCNSPLEETTIITDSSPYLPSTSSEPAVVSTTTMNSLQTTTFTDSKITLPSTSFEAPETLTCFACSGKDCETGRIGTETCSNGDICSYVNIQIFIEEGNPVFLLERGCKSADQLNTDPCVTSADYVGLDFMLTTTGEACFCDYSFCNNPLEETLTCFACSGKDCETGRIGTETCSNGDICSYVNIQIFIEEGNPVFLLERGCKSANQFNADPCVTSADYVGLDFMLTTTGEACFCDYSFCNNPLEETTIITDSLPNLPSTSSEPAVVSTTTMNSLQTTTFTDSKITLPSTSFEAPETLTCFACSGKDCETGRIGTETCSNGDICSYVNIQIFIEEGNPVFLLERGCKSADQLNTDPCVTSADYVGLDFMLTTTGEACFCDYSFCNNPLEETLTCFACSGKDCETGRIGTETCSNGDICSYVNIQIFIEEGNPVFLLERGCKSANQFNADPCVTSADYVGLDFMLTTTGEACFCDYSFCNNPLEETTIITDSLPNLPSTSSEPAVVSTTTMNSLQTTTFTDSKVTLPSTSFEAPETLTCFACSGKDCETGRIGTETCSNGDICSYVNIQIFIEEGNPVFLLERGCKSADQLNTDPCVTSADYVGLDFMLTTTGEACFCDYSFCNNPLEETTIITDSSPNLPVTAQRSTSTQTNVTTILVFQSSSFPENFTLSWYVDDRNQIEGLFVQVQYHGMDDWFDISPKLEASTRKFSLSAFEVINVTAVRVIAIDRSGNEIAESVPHPIRHLESGTRQNSQPGGSSVIFFVIVIIATIALSLVLIIIAVKQHNNKKLRQETVYSDIEPNGNQNLSFLV
ncbi:uncharacterized protein [Apostichopus japonicus]|uniref:uncharacterized protein n=1 Tax=Stichopus japonicus TaxID=307972 RepID=UPI003AB62B94